jgi:hypothetical protein
VTKLQSHFSRIMRALLIVGFIAGGWSVVDIHAQNGGVEPAWDRSWPLSPAFVTEFEGDIPAELPAYALDIELDQATGAIRGELEVNFTNHTGRPIAELPFRLYPNAEYYGEGSISISAVVVDGERREPELSVGDTVLAVSLGRLLPVDRGTTIEMRFETIVPTDSHGSFGIFSHDAERDTWILADWYPIVAGWDEDSGWGLDPPTIWGDPTFAETSTYDLRLRVPSGMSVASTGSASLASSDSAFDTYAIETGPVREFALVLDDRFQVHEADATGTTVRLYLDGATDAPGASRMLQSAVTAVDAFAERYGPYPFDELDIVQTELASALGVSWSGVIFMQASGMAAALGQPDSLVDQMQFTLVHEIGHQWWGNMIGVNSNDHAFMNESLTNYLTIVAFEDIFGRATGLALLERSLAGVYLAQLAESGDGVVDLPIEEVDSMTSYSRLVYGKGALGFLAIRLEIGDEAFFHALESYARTHAFLLAAPEDLRAAFEETSGRTLDDLWRFWFDASEATAADVEILLGLALAA